ncbi:MAG: winged helix-turn-helix domain-containing protein [Chloroflexi bacterium]|nr:winged helix-turn-helix domain-containing protein [Chloroflexota bacterium]
MTNKPTTEFRVFLASPSDVLAERQIAFRVIDQVNSILEDLRWQYRFKVYSWEKRTFPDAGTPQTVILTQIPIEQCDVLIGIFWRRFGTAPGMVRQSDGKPYLSGTEVEINEAFAARKQSLNGRPIIMLYRKLDEPTGKMSDNDQLQYARVIQYFRECASDGEHQALVHEFTGQNFAESLQEHLLRVVAKLEEDDWGDARAFPRLPQSTDSGVAAEFEDDPQEKWLAQSRLTNNPFKHNLAQNEKQSLPRYFVPLKDLRVPELLNAVQPWIVFGNAGDGKTALRAMLASYCYPRNSSSKILCIELELDTLEKIMQNAHGTLERVEPLHAIQGIESLAIESVPSIGLVINRPLEAKSLTQDPRRRLSSLIGAAQKAGFRHLICLVDEVDEPQVVQGQPEKMARLLTALMKPSVREVPGVTFGYLLPTTVKSILQNQRTVFRLDRCRVVALTWSNADLQKLIRQRMTYYSRDQLAPYHSLGELCERGNFAENIDDEIAALAAGNPRAMLWLANRLIELHCAAEPLTIPIQYKTWENVKVDWWTSGHDQLLGGAEENKGFYIANNELWFAGRAVKLSPLYHAVLRYLLQANGRICSIRELGQAGWSEPKTKERTVAETIRRMKLALENQNIDPRWIENVRGRGYRIRKPSPDD